MGGQSKIEVEGATIGSIIFILESSYPGVGEKLLDGEGKLKRFINVFVNESEIRQLQGLDTPVRRSKRSAPTASKIGWMTANR
jgi:molybdopterin converting factor small subunit